jgi:hypothetical protein
VEKNLPSGLELRLPPPLNLPHQSTSVEAAANNQAQSLHLCQAANGKWRCAWDVQRNPCIAKIAKDYQAKGRRLMSLLGANRAVT